MWKLFAVVFALNGFPHYQLYVMDAVLDSKEFITYKECMEFAATQDHKIELFQLGSNPKRVGKTIAFGCLTDIKSRDSIPQG